MKWSWLPISTKAWTCAPGACARLPERLQKAPPIRIILKNRPASVPTIENVVNGSCKFNACFAGHKQVCFLPALRPPSSAKFSILKLTPKAAPKAAPFSLLSPCDSLNGALDERGLIVGRRDDGDGGRHVSHLTVLSRKRKRRLAFSVAYASGSAVPL